MTKRSRSWKDNTKERKMKRYGRRSTERYDSPFMTLDTAYLKYDGEEEEA